MGTYPVLLLWDVTLTGQNSIGVNLTLYNWINFYLQVGELGNFGCSYVESCMCGWQTNLGYSHLTICSSLSVEEELIYLFYRVRYVFLNSLLQFLI